MTLKVNVTQHASILLHGLDRLAEERDRERAAGRRPRAVRLIGH